MSLTEADREELVEAVERIVAEHVAAAKAEALREFADWIVARLRADRIGGDA